MYICIYVYIYSCIYHIHVYIYIYIHIEREREIEEGLRFRRSGARLGSRLGAIYSHRKCPCKSG